MFADTLTFSVNAVNKVLRRIREPGASSVYQLREADGVIRATIRQTSYSDKARGKTVMRHSLELVHTVFAVAPATVPEIRKAYITIENDSDTADTTLTRYISKSLCDFVGTAANADQLLGEEY